MHLIHLSPTTLYQAIIRGCQSVISKKEQLNAINIFPVADGDTGDNLASTANAIMTNSTAHPRFTDMLQSIADASLYGARGNSGIIFSQFFNALALEQYDKKIMTTVNFAETLINAASCVRASILSPIEGTILTMIEAFAYNADKLSKHINCFNQLMDELTPILNAILKTTTDRIDVLKSANIVDAGALGFYFFVEGFTSLLAGDTSIENNYSENVAYPIEHQLTTPDTIPTHRYCTELIIKSESIDKTQLSKELEKHGDCLAFTGNQKSCRLHIHCNKPSDIFSISMKYGVLEHPKVDDMLRQYQVAHQRKHDIAIVTDSSCDIPVSLRDEHQIHLIPLNIHLDEHQLLDRYSIEPNFLYQHLKSFKSHPKTSLPSPALVEEKLSFLAQHYKNVLVIPIAKSMSGTFNVMTQAAQKYSNVKVIDSRTNSGAQGLLIQYACELINAGCSFEKLINHIEEAILETSLFVMVNDLDAMTRSGRINHVAGRIGQFSGIKPIVSLDKTGKGTYFASAFKAKHALSKIIATIKKMYSVPGKELERYCIIHAGVEEKACDFAQRTTDAFQKKPVYIENVSPAIGLHAGYGCIALAARIIERK